MKRKAIVGLFIAAALLPNIAAQEPPELRVDSVKSVPGLVSPPALLLPVKCNSGQLYLRMYDGQQNRTILRIDSSTLRFAELRPNDFEGMKDAVLVDFSPASGGGLDVLMALQTKEKTVDYYVLTSDSGDRFNRRVRLQLSFGPRQFVHFRSGSFLIAGQETHETPTGNTSFGGKPVLGLFDFGGQLIRGLSFKGDLEPPKDSQLGAAASDYDSTLMTSTLEAADDDDASLLRPNGLTFIVSANGTVKNTLRPKAPDGTFLLSAKLGHGAAVFVYGKRRPPSPDGVSRGIQSQYFVVYDLATGDEVARYMSSDPALGAALSCYSRDEFIFIRPGKSGVLDVVTAIPRP